MTRTAEKTYAEFAARLLATGLVSDPWLWGSPRFRPEPVVLTTAEKAALDAAAESVAMAHHHLMLQVAAEPGLLDSFFDLTPCQKLMALAAGPHWHGIARADVFRTAREPIVCELNSDTPSGEAEAVLLGAFAAEDRPGHEDPTAGLEDRFCRMVETAARSLTGATGPLRVGIVYPTEMTEDLSMVLLYRRWFEARGWSVVLGSPFNLRRLETGGVAVFETPCDVIIRHYKTDWFGERLSVWDDAAPLPDAEPLDVPLDALLGAALEGRVAVINPFGSAVTQNKKCFAFFWERLESFPRDVQEAIRRFVPPTFRLDSIDRGRILAEKDRWVLKSDYGCEGDEVIIGRECTEDVWRESLEHVLPGRWVAQEWFEALTDDGGSTVNFGVYLVAGEASGMYARISEGPTDARALSAPVLVRSGEP